MEETEFDRLKTDLAKKDKEIQKLQESIKFFQKDSEKENINENSSILMNHIRFLEKRLERYEKVVPFDINNSSTYRRNEEEDENTNKKTISTINHSPKNNIFFSNEKRDNQKVIKKICEGTTSISYKVIDKRTMQVMCKKVIKNNNDEFIVKKLQNSMKDISALLDINHPCICHTIGFNSAEQLPRTSDKGEYESYDDYEEEEEGEEEEDFEAPKTTVALYLEYLPYKLNEYLKSDIMNNTLKTKIAVEVAFGMCHLHEMGIIHRNLKIENILLNYIFEAKIIDFDLIHFVEDEEDREKSITKETGNLEYIPPEMLNEKNYNFKTDVYSYGILLFVLFTGHLPRQDLNDKMAKNPLQFPRRHATVMTTDCIELIKKCTSYDPNDRPNFNEIIDFIEDRSFRLAKMADTEIIRCRFQQLSGTGEHATSNQSNTKPIVQPIPPKEKKTSPIQQRTTKKKPIIRKPF